MSWILPQHPVLLGVERFLTLLGNEIRERDYTQMEIQEALG